MYYQLIVEKDISIKVRDETILCADVFRPNDSGRFPVIMTMGPYPKDIHFKDWIPNQTFDNIGVEGTYMHWETVDPEWWVPQGYVVIRVDTRGTGKSPGRPRILTMREAEDFYDAVEWAGTQTWSNGNVAVMGVSYFAMNSWRVAALNPPHLAAIVPWEGAFDLYRDANRHGGILSNTFTQRWTTNTISRGMEAGTSYEERARQGAALELYNERWAHNNPDLTDIKVPLLSAGNWGGVGLHLRGNVEGYLGAGSEHKFLRIHSGDHVTPFYSMEGRLFQKRFLDQWLKGIDTGITREPPIKLAIRHGGDSYQWHYEYEWPLARTQWTEYYLNAADGTLSTDKPDQQDVVSYSAKPDADTMSATFSTAPFQQDTEVTGPIKLKLWASSSIDDADLFAIIHNIDPNGEEVTYPGQNQPAIAAAYGWLRVSHRKLDPERSTPYRPYHIHDELQKVKPGEVVTVEIEILPASMVFEKGHRLVLEVASKDDPRIDPFTHTDPADRIQAGTHSIHTGDAYDSHLLLPVIPPRP
ncbi:CocE/NonD family hydrolase [Chloroflexota bacterium]